MSTFNGIVKEFPDIRIDYFRLSGGHSRRPLALFLSHVHSDHLQGLESCKSPFIYCSPATREILLRLEKYPHRMNFAKGILESRKQTYKHLNKLLKTIPLETPIEIELAPSNTIRVTLFNANHCVGAVMFLIEDGGNAILYTGDIRSELWWVNSLTRHPILLPYAYQTDKKPFRLLSCIYLDTTFATKDNPYRDFPSKAEGVAELLQKVSKYPKNTTFYFDSWTFGYEEVWLALSNFLGCQVHVDQYRHKLYTALVTGKDPKAAEGCWLLGFTCGNHSQRGCLTEQQTTQLHSCEQGTRCEIFSKDFVRITPIISRHDGIEMVELGAGGGQGDLDQKHELEVYDGNVLNMLIQLCEAKLPGRPELLSSVVEMLKSLFQESVYSVALDASALHSDQATWDPEDMQELDHIPLRNLVPAIVSGVERMKARQDAKAAAAERTDSEHNGRKSNGLAKRITFPYSRHSSYTELCHLIDAFKPGDIHPCTVDHANWSPDRSMSFLFGHLYDSPHEFSYDQQMLHEKRGAPSSTAPYCGPDFSAAQSSDGHQQPTRSQDVGQHLVTPKFNTCSSGIMVSSPSPESVKPQGSLAQPATVTGIQIADSMRYEQRQVLSSGPKMQLRREMDEVTTVPTGQEQPNKRRRLSHESYLQKSQQRMLLDKPTVSPATSPGRLPSPSSVESAVRPLSPRSLFEAIKQEVHDAVLEKDGEGWAEFSLVSISGHQERESEL